jgi:hypothetical protein
VAQPVTEAMVRSLFAEEAEPDCALVTLYAGTQVVRFSDWPSGLVSTAGPRLAGEVAAQAFPYRPFRVRLTGAGAERPAREVEAEAADPDGALARFIRTAQGEIAAAVQCVRVAAPNAVELSATGLRVTESDLAGASVILTLVHRSYDEPAVQARYVYARTPGLF